MKIKAKTVEKTNLFEKLPFNTYQQFDRWQLEIRLEFMDMDAPVYVTFRCVIGYRMLYDSNLLEMWNPETRPVGWLWEIECGGWFDLEKKRNDFVTGINPPEALKEYLLITDQECYSVLCTTEPAIFCEYIDFDN